jgi:hypothetical protein
VVYLGVEVLEFKKQMFIKQVAFQNIKRGRSLARVNSKQILAFLDACSDKI